MVHQYKLNGYNIVLDSCSGSIHSVDEVAYDIIAMYKEKSPEEIVRELLVKYAHRSDVTEEELYACIADVAAQGGEAIYPGQFCRHGRNFQRTLRGRGEGHVPPCGPHLQPELFLLFCQPGQVSRGAGPDEL